ncbi:uncharacterized protein LOC101856802 [Aplysia californica]|uniref:Uncharacterized protein LOC101856802 n=1 Tax=Aplysia californica TaxID=6500 RepID=A0ABM0JMN9_APLCA|nr:uncharacterized protein LOC101856802 [Aplysia californica]
MDNASYHNVVEEEDNIPTSASRKEEMTDWLNQERIPFAPSQLKPELLLLVEERRKAKRFQVDQIVEQHGHICLRWPPYHTHLNTIELVWAKIKGTVASQKTNFKLKDVKQLSENVISRVDKVYWRQWETHGKRMKDEYWEKEGLEFIQPRVVINPCEDSSDSLTEQR